MCVYVYLQLLRTCCNRHKDVLQCAAVYCSVLQCLQCVTGFCNVLRCALLDTDRNCGKEGRTERPFESVGERDPSSEDEMVEGSDVTRCRE